MREGCLESLNRTALQASSSLRACACIDFNRSHAVAVAWLFTADHTYSASQGCEVSCVLSEYSPCGQLCQVREQAERLEEALGEGDCADDYWNAPTLECSICRKSIDNIKAHLMSLEHFEALKAKLQEEIGRLGSLEAVMQQKSKFVQNFEVAAFQHLKPEVIYQ
ncbi:unnamed protein product [Symbiodinium natans]|uniref:Uncharacterized protein n=1 Tax=Symbiodinium natans TaxID=878477 RepID=A0A812Q3B8_9DINO|nr:unnamed protein product [Symbiodinium natans]